MRRRGAGRLSERLLRLVVRDRESCEGLLGDLEQEAARADAAGRPFDHPGAVRGLAWSFLLDRLSPRRRHLASAEPTGPLRAASIAASDLRDAARLLRRHPGYATAVVVTLALGFGAATAVLSVAYGVWIRPLPFGRPEGLVRVYEVKVEGTDGSVSGQGANRPGSMDADVARRARVSPPLLHDMRGHEWRTIAQMAAVSGLVVDMTREADSERLAAVAASRGVFAVLQLQPLAGRAFDARAGTREVLLSEGFWQREFGSDPDIIGRDSLVLDGHRHVIVGVVADGLPYPQSAAELWIPADLDDSQLTDGMRGARYLDVVARLRADATIAAASAEIDAFVRELGADHPNHEGWGGTVVSLRGDLIRPFLGILRLLVAAAVLFLVIACTNVTGLVAARRVRDRGERSVRRALGASAWRLLRLDGAEMMILAVVSALATALIAGWALAPLRRLAPADVPRIADIRLDPLIMGAAGLGLFAAAAVIALLGSTLAVRAGTSISAGSTRTTARGTAGRSTLTVVQVALTTLLLIAGVALAGHFRGLARIDPGFGADRAVVTPVVLSEQAYPDDASRLLFFESVIGAMESRGHTAAVATNPPMAGITMRFGFRAGDWEQEQHWGQYHTVSERYFEIMGIPLAAGRLFTAGDRADAAAVVIISETLAREYFDGDPVGREMIVVGAAREIVGVVGAVRHFGPDQPAPPEMYVPMAQNPWLLGHILVSAAEPLPPGAVREAVAGIDPQVPVPTAFGYERFLRTWFAPLRFQLTVLSLLAMAGTALALVGLYALVSYVVAGRRREIGIRMALGETAGRVFARLVGRGVSLAAAGLSLGVLGALALRGVARSLGTGIELSDPIAVLAVIALVATAAVGASAWPARRAAKIDPVVALRQE